MTQVLDALCCAHAQGIVHRDLKPENIIITRTGLRRNATVLDFGLSGFTEGAIARDALRLTASRELMGTPSYAAPEQLRGEVPSPGSDIYSWGLVLLECLTGEVAMSGRTPHEVVMMQIGPDPVPIPPGGCGATPVVCSPP
jgi:serine/threonine protein kinase